MTPKSSGRLISVLALFWCLGLSSQQLGIGEYINEDASALLAANPDPAATQETTNAEGHESTPVVDSGRLRDKYIDM